MSSKKTVIGATTLLGMMDSSLLNKLVQPTVVAFVIDNDYSKNDHE